MDIKDRNALLWVLFSDANSRFNTLIEECAHLQDTIIGLVGQSNLVREIIKSQQTHDKIQGFDRPIACNPRNHSDYYEVPVRDRAFLSLWNALGALIKGLDSNQSTHRREYERVHREAAKPVEAQGGPEHSEVLYWYLAQRGYFIQTVFQHYTDQLEHAHEKLIQMLENQPGTLPNPILLRRWNSAAYGDFLSEYSRHVNWEAKAVVTKLIGPDVTLTSDRPESLTHTWTHQPTSYAASFDVNLKLDGPQESDEAPMRFASIRSAYFYMEQPVLLPLLYHECVHVNFPSNEDFATAPETFFGSRLEVNKSLRLAQFPVTDATSTYENFWDHFTEEVWSDAISIALGGRAYLLSLALQLFGKSGELDFNHYKIEEDTLYELDKLGGTRYRKYQVAYPELSLEFFWEARMLIACDVLRELRPLHTRFSSLDTEMADAVIGLIESWTKSGAHAYDQDATSHAHAELWRHKAELNLWVRKCVLGGLHKHIPELARTSNVCSTYQLNSRQAAGWITRSVNNYRRNHLQVDVHDEFKLEPNFRLENVAVDVRWQLAHDVAAVASRTEISDWTTGFANWMRNDGGVAFRMALECSRVRCSLLEALADLAAGVASEDDSLPGGVWSELSSLLPHLDGVNKELRTNLIRRRALFNVDMEPKDAVVARPILEGIDRLTDTIIATLSARVPQSGPSQSTEVGVGTLSLGVIRPEEFAEAPGTDSAYDETLQRITAGLQKAAHEQCHLALVPKSPSRGAPKFETAVLPLVGEYQFAAYTTNSTPVERDFHGGKEAMRLLTKPRLVLSAGGRDLHQSINEHVGKHYGRLALIRFRYRWQWFDLEAKLQRRIGRALVGYSLLLSSGWEDAVLVTWHEEAADVWSIRDAGLDVACDDVDVQSSFHVKASPSAPLRIQTVAGLSPRDDHWLEELKRWAQASGLVDKIYERSGRYDYTVVWKWRPDEPGSGLDMCAQGLAFFPRRLWAGVASTISSFESRSWVSSDPNNSGMAPLTGSQPEGVQLFKAVSHFALREKERHHRKRAAPEN